jgi:protein-L-isoaspartate(D-aspartate) O-methyltransferase
MVKIIHVRRMIVPLKLMLSFSFYITLTINSACAKDSFEMQRNKMVENQIIALGIKDPHVISAILKVERHLFVPEEHVKFAYNDTPLSIGYNQTSSQP